MSEQTRGPVSEAGTRDKEIGDLEVEPARGVAERERDRTFKIAMTLAALLHALFFVSLINGKPRRIGNPEGSREAISVSILTEKDLKSRSTMDDAAKQGPEGPAAPTPPPPPLKPAIETPPSPPAPPEETKPVEEQTPPKEEPKPPKEEPKPEEQKADTTPEPAPVPPFETETEKADEKREPEKKEVAPPAPNVAEEALKELLETSDPFKAEKKRAAEKAETEKTQRTENRPRPPKPERQQIPDMAMPGGGTGMQRPPGYTKSGENDAFARGVIRALQRTMPQLRNTFGTVTVRIDLDRNGNLVKVSILKPSGVAGLDQSVAFAVQQSSFPLPPVNATPADLTFFVRYVYN